MNSNAIAAFLALNILITGGLGYLVVIGQQKLTQKGSNSPEINVDTSSIQEPLAELTDKVDQLNHTVQRFSTSYVQYEFLKREMDRLSVVDQTIGVRAQATAATKTEKNAEEVDKVIGNLSSLSQQVKGQLQSRRQTMLKLISGLEKELASISGSQESSSKPVPAPVSPIPLTADPLGVPEIKPAMTSDPGAATIQSAENPD